MPSPNTTAKPEKPYSPKVQAAYLLLLKALEDFKTKYPTPLKYYGTGNP